MNISNKILIYFLLMAILLFISFFNLTSIFNDARKAEQIQAQRYEFYKLVNEHKESTNVFTNIFASYVNTTEQSYKNKINKILDKVEFKNKEVKEYRDNILKEFSFDGVFRVNKKKKNELIKFLDTLELTKDYFKDYFFADKLSHKLLEMEFEAINAIRGLYKDEKGFYNIRKEPSYELANKLFNNKKYLGMQNDINKNINKLFIDIDKALIVYIKQLERDEREAYIISMILSSLLLILVLFFYLLFKEEIVNPLNDLTLWIKQMKRNEFKIKDVVFNNDEIGTIMNSFNEMALRIQEYIKKLEHLSSTDSLTKLNNRSFLDKSLKQSFYNKSRYKNPCSIIILDIDHFKEVNDTYGHLIGDSVLQELSELLSSKVRLTDVVGRWGGEEFLVICNNTDLHGAKQIAEKLRISIEKANFSTVNKKTASFGLACFNDSSSIDEVIKRADDALYDAKRTGRNKVVCR